MRIAAIVVVVLAVIVVALLYEGRPEPKEDLRAPKGPSSVLRGIRQRAKAQQMRAQRERAKALEAALQSDAGAP